MQHSSGGRNGTGFHGCLRNLYINGKLQDLAAGLRPRTSGSATTQSTTRQWLGQGVEPGCQPCQRASCLQGDCHPTGHRGFSCTCHPGWTGTLCDQQVNNPCDGNKWVHLSRCYCFNKCLFGFLLALPVAPSSGVSTAPAFQSTLTPTPAAASPVTPVCSATSRTRMRRIPAVSLSVNTESAGCQAWARPTASATVGIQERRAKEVRKSRR